jgi:plasmid stabilization system protein ParE
MPQVIFSSSALRDLERLRKFLQPNKYVIRQASARIKKAIQLLEENPCMGRKVEEMGPEYREFIISFGNSGYVVLYHFDDGNVTILALRHQREIDY